MIWKPGDNALLSGNRVHSRFNNTVVTVMDLWTPCCDYHAAQFATNFPGELVYAVKVFTGIVHGAPSSYLHPLTDPDAKNRDTIEKEHTP